MVNAAARLTTQRNAHDPVETDGPECRVEQGHARSAPCSHHGASTHHERELGRLECNTAGLRLPDRPQLGRQTLAGYNPGRLTAMWQEASKGGGDLRELKRMRRDNPMAFTDGVYPTPTMP